MSGKKYVSDIDLPYLLTQQECFDRHLIMIQLNSTPVMSAGVKDSYV